MKTVDNSDIWGGRGIAEHCWEEKFVNRESSVILRMTKQSTL